MKKSLSPYHLINRSCIVVKMSERYKHEKRGDDASSITVVLKVDLHCNCNGCMDKVLGSARSVQGVVNVKGDFANNRVTVIGKIDPVMLCKQMELKSKKKIELISPRSQPNSCRQIVKMQHDKSTQRNNRELQLSRGTKDSRNTGALKMMVVKDPKIYPQGKEKVKLTIERHTSRMTFEGNADDLCQVANRLRIK